MRQKYLDNISRSGYGDIPEALFHAAGSLYEEQLNTYRSLNQSRSKIISMIKEHENRLGNIGIHANELRRKLNRINVYFSIILVLMVIFLLLAILVHSPVFIALLIVIVSTLYYVIIMRRHTLNDLTNDEINTNQIKMNMKKLEEELNHIESSISNFKLPDMKVKVYRFYIPIGVIKFKTTTGLNYTLGILPTLKDGLLLKFAYIGVPEDINNAIGEIRQYDERYRDALIKEKTEGIKIINELRKINIWEEVYKARSPESILVRSLVSLENVVKMINYDEYKLPLIKPSSENIEFVNKILGLSIDGYPQNVDKDSENNISISISKLEDLYNTVVELSNIKGAVIETQYMADASSNYRNLSEKIYDLVIKSIPIDPFSSFIESIYCKKCVEKTLEEYTRNIDLKRWINVNILGGVSEDPDIVNIPSRLKKDEDIKRHVNSINRLIIENVPLPGLEDTQSSSIEDYWKAYREAITRYALIISGADSYIKYVLTSPFEEPKMICEVCSENIKAEDLYHVSNLALPYIKGYIAVMYELQDDLFKKSESIRLSVNQSRLSKDQRKSMLSIDETMRNDLLIKIKDVEYGLKNNIEYINKLKELLLNSEISSLLQASRIFNILSSTQGNFNIQEQVIEYE